MANVIHVEDQHALVETSAFPHAVFPFAEFNPIQSRMFEIYEGDTNAVIAAATASGKTATAELFMANQVRTGCGKAIYIGPMKALAKQKYDNWTKKKHHFNDLKVSVCTGDYRITDKRKKELEEADIIIMTPEMLASKVRNYKSEKSTFLNNVSVVVFDEAHLLCVPKRGTHIEVALMKLTELSPNVRIVLLSATLPNVDEICGWVCKLTKRDTYYLESKYRPVPLTTHYEPYYDGDRYYDAKEEQKVAKAVSLINRYIKDKFLAFVHTKRTGQLLVKQLASYGVEAEFHNADLDFEKRLNLEERFENGDLRVLVATSTMAWGIELPARRVVIVGIDRGLQRVENYDILQEVGRAGRPSFDPRGDAYILVPESKKVEAITWLKTPTRITSKLLDDMAGHHKELAFHLVSEIHQGNIRTKEGFHTWFHRSLAYYQQLDFDDEVIDNVIELLVKNKAVIVENGEYRVTSVGIVASMFYFSPFDVADLKNNFTDLFDKRCDKNDYALAVALANIDSFRFGQIVNRGEKAEIESFQKKIDKAPDAVAKFAFAYYNIINGVENPIFGSIQAGLRLDFERTLEVLVALDSMAGKWGKDDYFQQLKLRMNYGVKAEYVELVRVPNIGKVRAEKLYKAGVRTLEQLISADAAKISKLLNLKAEKIKECVSAAQKIKLQEMLS